MISARITRHARYSLAVLLAVACVDLRGDRGPWNDLVVASLEASDGYLFVFSPFNCSLRSAQITAMNELAIRRRRTGRILTVGHELADSNAAADAVRALGIRLPTRPLASTPLGRGHAAGLSAPLAIAIRHRRVVAVLAGPEAERLHTWIAWLEQTNDLSNGERLDHGG